jgi:hypothetical protein
MICIRNPCSIDGRAPDGYTRVKSLHLNYISGTQFLNVYASEVPMSAEDEKEVSRLVAREKEVNSRDWPIWV